MPSHTKLTNKSVPLQKPNQAEQLSTCWGPLILRSMVRETENNLID
jgi:hypothetical protein